MKKIFLLVLPVIGLAACNKCDDEQGDICTDEFRMITLTVQSPAKAPIVLDSVYTIRQSSNEKIGLQQSMGPGFYVVLDDSYHPRLKKAEDNFRFVGWKNNQVVVEQTYRIAGDNCHISKRSGVDSVTIQ